MTKGGARNRSGPRADPNSGRSERRGLTLTVLPAEGYTGEPPEFPLKPVQLMLEHYEGSGADRTFVREPDEDGTELFREREKALWAWVWTLPQAVAWAREPWRWYAVAMWVRTAVVCEGAEAQAADKNSLHRFADQIGMTPAGLRENGWSISVDEVGQRRGEDDVDEPEDDPRARLTVVTSGGA